MRAFFSTRLPSIHAGHDVVRAQEGRVHLADDVRAVLAAVVHEAGIALLRHGRGDVGVLAAFLQDDPGARLCVLDHDVVDHRADAHGRGGERRGDLERHVHGREARRVERVLDGTRKAERGGHRVAVKGPAVPLRTVAPIAHMLKRVWHSERRSRTRRSEAAMPRR